MTRWIWVELSASATTLAGIYLGSTTLNGAICYAASLVFWWWFTVGRKVWGLVPLNLASTAIVALNIWRSL